jgi:hypothetical protein
MKALASILDDDLNVWHVVAMSVFVVLATYITFELLPFLYDKRWLPVATMLCWFGAFEGGCSVIRKRLRKEHVGPHALDQVG